MNNQITDAQTSTPIGETLSIGAVFQEAFNSLKKHLGTFVLSSLIVGALVVVAYGVITFLAVIVGAIFFASAFKGGSTGALLLIGIVLGILVFLALMAGGLVLAANFYDIFIRRVIKGEDVKIGSIFEFNRPYGQFILGSFLTGISLFFGFLFFIIPGIFLSIKLAQVPFLILDEKLTATQAMEKSWQVTGGERFWKLFLNGFCLFLLALAPTAIGYLLLAVTGTSQASFGSDSMFNDSLSTSRSSYNSTARVGSIGIAYLIITVVQNVASLVISSFAFFTNIVIYKQLKEELKLEANQSA
jgi:hypothetical protein